MKDEIAAIERINGDLGERGEHPGINAARSSRPSRRKVSRPWMRLTAFAAVVSVPLMGAALLGAFDAFRAPAAPVVGGEREWDSATKTDRLARAIVADEPAAEIMDVSTVRRENGKDVVQVAPFLRISASLGARHNRDFNYPQFDAFDIFSVQEPANQTAEINPKRGSIYGAEVESKVTIGLAEFDPGDPAIAAQRASASGNSDIERKVRDALFRLAPEEAVALSVEPLAYATPLVERQETGLWPEGLVSVSDENVTRRGIENPLNSNQPYYQERIARVRKQAPIPQFLADEGIAPHQAETLARMMQEEIEGERLLPEDQLHIAAKINDPHAAAGTAIPELLSLYRGGKRLVALARENGGYVKAPNAPHPQAKPVSEAFAANPQNTVLPSDDMPKLYDAIYRVALSSGLTPELTRQLIRIVASEADLQAPAGLSDWLSVFASLEEGHEKATEESKIVRVSLTLGERQLRYYLEEGSAPDRPKYFDQDGKSAKRFLLEQPAPGGRFESAFGMRMHPILKRRRMHWGVDWSAPRGSPILAAGDGVVEKAGWAPAAGRRTLIRHGNGYSTLYAHQWKIAPEVQPGARVKQGQVIGWVGSTGLSTGPHLHYEIIIDGVRVDPLKVELPNSEVLEGARLAAFQGERKRIDALLDGEAEDSNRLALR